METIILASVVMILSVFLLIRSTVKEIKEHITKETDRIINELNLKNN